MPQLENDEGGPREEAASYVVATDIHSVPRCTHCGHVIWSDLSVQLGIGPECRRRAA